jgi:hypothetical protein
MQGKEILRCIKLGPRTVPCGEFGQFSNGTGHTKAEDLAYSGVFMPALRRKVGRNIRHLAMKRRSKAILSFMTAVLMVAMPLGIAKMANILNQPISVLNSQRVQVPPFPISFYCYGLFVLMAWGLTVKRSKQLSFVTPIIAFSRAKVVVPPRKVRGVYVVEKSRLTSLLKELS